MCINVRLLPKTVLRQKKISPRQKIPAAELDVVAMWEGKVGQDFWFFLSDELLKEKRRRKRRERFSTHAS